MKKFLKFVGRILGCALVVWFAVWLIMHIIYDPIYNITSWLS